MTLFGHETPVRVYHVIGKTSEIPFYIMSYEIVTVLYILAQAMWCAVARFGEKLGTKGFRY